MDDHKSQEWFNVSPIVQKILEHFNHEELLLLSLVNKTWNYEAKTLLKLRGNTVATIGRGRAEPKACITCYCSKRRGIETHCSSSVKFMFDEPRRSTRNEHNVFQDFANFVDICDSMIVVPFSGLQVNANMLHSAPCESVEHLADNIASLGLSLRTLHFAAFYDKTQIAEMETLPAGLLDNFGLQDPPKRKCNPIKILNLILKANAPQLMELSVLGFNPDYQEGGNIWSSLAFPQLKTLTFDHQRSRELHDFMEFVNNVVRNAPKLEQFHWDCGCHADYEDGFCGDVDESWITELEGREALFVVHRTPSQWRSIPKDRFQHFAVRSVYNDLYEYNYTDQYEGYKVLLPNSRTTLRKGLLDILLLEQIVSNGLPYTQLLALNLMMDLQTLRQKWWTLLKAPIWRKFFPALKEIRVSRPWYARTFEEEQERITRELESMDGLISELTNGSWAEENDSSMWPGIEILSIDGGNLDLNATDCEFMLRMFPNIKVLDLEHFGVTHAPTFFGTMKHIEKLILRRLPPQYEGYAYDCIFEGILCGIHAEEVAELRKMDTEYLKAVHIVPIHPPLAYARSLRLLEYSPRHRDPYINPCFGTRNSEPFAIPRVSLALCFNRMPGLTIKAVFRSSEDKNEMMTMMKEFPEVNIQPAALGSFEYDYYDDVE